MKVVCIANVATSLSENYLDARAGYLADTEFRLTISKEYVVYALALRDKQVWYYICDDADLYYPVHQPAPLFEVIDNTVSKYWRFKFTAEPNPLDNIAVFAFDEWVSDEYFYDHLTDKAEIEVSLFWQMKYLMDLEAAEPKTSPFEKVG